MHSQIILIAITLSLTSAANLVNLVKNPTFATKIQCNCCNDKTASDLFGSDRTSWKTTLGRPEKWCKSPNTMDLNSDIPYILSQLITTFTPGLEYKLSFEVNRNSRCDGEVTLFEDPTEVAKTGIAYVDQNGLTTSELPFSSEGNIWIPYSQKFYAKSTDHQINFKSTSTGKCGPLIRNVQVAENLIRNRAFESACTRCTKLPSYLFPDKSWTSDSPRVEKHAPYTVDLNYEYAVDGVETTAPYVLSQLITFEPKQKYTVSFEVNRNRYCDQDQNPSYPEDLRPKTGVAYVDQNTLTTPELLFTSEYEEKGSPWKTYWLTFTALKTEHKINFKSTTKGTKCGPLIKNVNVFWVL